MGMNRKQFGLLTGYSPKTIKRYEYVKCSKKYYDLTTELILKHEIANPKNQR